MYGFWLANILSVLLWCTASEYHFSIFKVSWYWRDVSKRTFEIQKPKQPLYIKSIFNARSDRWGSHGYDRMSVGFTSTYAISASGES